MNVANSAKALCVLGATLVLVTTPNVSNAGIEGANVLGIEGANALGIEGANALGIEGANALGIEGANALGIEGANILGIEGANALGIEGANILGIEGANVLGIEGANVTGIEGANTFEVLVGPVAAVNVELGSFSSLGQSIMTSDEMLNQLNIGDLVSVQGSVAGPGWLYADSITISADQYVAGATEVFVTGILSSIDASTGAATLGDLQVDYTSSLSTGSMPAGILWSFRGTQPGNRGMMLSDKVEAY